MAKRRETASAMVKRLKKKVPGLVREFTSHMRRGDCRGAADALGHLAQIDSFPSKYTAYSGRAPRIVTSSSLRRLNNLYKRACTVSR